jgi:hypothetical protein
MMESRVNREILAQQDHKEKEVKLGLKVIRE